MKKKRKDHYLNQENNNWKYIPNILSILRIFVTITILFIIFFSFFSKNIFLNKLIWENNSLSILNWNILAVSFFAFAAITDYFDGLIARKKNAITEFGKVMDQVSDKVLVNFTLIALTIIGQLPIWITLLFIFRDVITNALRILMAKKNMEVQANSLGKIKTVLTLVAIIFPILFNSRVSLLNTWYLFLPLIFGLLISYISMFLYIKIFIKNNSDFNIFNELHKKLINNKASISVVESYTGGSFSNRMISFPKASKYFLAGGVLYSNLAKKEFGLKEEFILKYGTISSEVVLELNRIQKEKYNAKINVSFCGNAGPDVIEGKEKGECFVAINNKSYHLKYGEKLKRKQIIDNSVNFVALKLIELLEEK